MTEPINLNAVTTDRISFPDAAQTNVMFEMLRLDKIHSLVSGNKYFKLYYYLEEADRLNKKMIVTWGGAWSNHILATAAACKMKKLRSIGIIRGEEPGVYSIILDQASKLGMELHFVTRLDYSGKKIPSALDKEEFYFIPEGGYGPIGATGASSILDYVLKENYSDICCAVGTGTMMAGLINASTDTQRVTGISVLKNNSSIQMAVEHLTAPRENYSISHDYHFGGYARYDSALLALMNSFYLANRVPTDFVYTGKMIYAVNVLLQQGYFPARSRVLLIHSGGLCGNLSLQNGTLIF